MTEQLIAQLGYVGIALILILGGLGLPIPEEAPIIVAAVLSRNGKLSWPLALGSCLSGVLLGDLVVYFLGFFYGEKVLSLPAHAQAVDPPAGESDQGLFSPPRVQDSGLGTFRARFPHGCVSDGGNSQASAAQAGLDRSGGRVSQHDVLFWAGIRFRLSDPARNSRSAAMDPGGGGGRRRGLAAHSLLSRPAPPGQPVGPPVLEDDLDPLSIGKLPGSQGSQTAASESEAETEASAKPEEVDLEPAEAEEPRESTAESQVADSSPAHLPGSFSSPNLDGVAVESAMPHISRPQSGSSN